jgi:hypothetical protein
MNAAMTLAEIKIMIEAEALRRQAARDGFDLEAVKAYLDNHITTPHELNFDVPAAPQPLTYHYFANLNYTQLVHACYLHLLRRTADPAGLQHWTGVLARGEEKALVIGRLAYSEEGRRHQAHVVGLRTRYWLAALTHVPVLGGLFAWLRAFASLHKRARAQRAFEQHVFAMVTSLAHHGVRANQDMALRIDALRHVLETRP